MTVPTSSKIRGLRGHLPSGDLERRRGHRGAHFRFSPSCRGRAALLTSLSISAVAEMIEPAGIRHSICKNN